MKIVMNKRERDILTGFIIGSFLIYFIGWKIAITLAGGNVFLAILMCLFFLIAAIVRYVND